ncbi:diacylglycerol kinase [Halotalea alkalilenta]|uniref:Diacylglycerol kinase n=1 Tax=Halotalea alkalilenta TaxID=376489 RepID=A0A172YL95_9GAMM|nr:diacylglycerol kinase [Halotalea alkalilenta]ANF59765.1 diacylglycerol kinase [Halotalea alkalilenta]
MKSANTGFTRLLHSTRYSWYGLRSGWRFEEAFRLEVVLLVVLFPATFWLARSFTDWLLLVGSALLVLIVELLNSAIEAVVDRVGSEYHELSGRAKDLGSAAVLISALFAALVWGGLLLVRLGFAPFGG